MSADYTRRVLRVRLDVATPSHARGCEGCPLAIYDSDHDGPIAVRCAAQPDGSCQRWPDYHCAPAPSWCPLRSGHVLIGAAPEDVTNPADAGKSDTATARDA